MSLLTIQTGLDSVLHTNFLGVLIDKNLRWKCRINRVSKTLSRTIGIMKILKFFVPDRILFIVHLIDLTLIMEFSFGGIHVRPTWINLFKLQKWAIRTISNIHYRSHTRPLFAKYNILNVNDMHSLEHGVFMYNYSINDLPKAINGSQLAKMKKSIPDMSPP